MRYALRIEISLNDFKMFNWGPILSKCSHVTCHHSFVNHLLCDYLEFPKHLDGWIEVQFLHNFLMWQARFLSLAHLAKNTCNQCKTCEWQSLLEPLHFLEMEWHLAPLWKPLLRQNPPIGLHFKLIFLMLVSSSFFDHLLLSYQSTTLSQYNMHPVMSDMHTMGCLLT